MNPVNLNATIVIVIPFTTLDPDDEHRFKGLYVASANIQGSILYLCHDQVFRNSALPMEMNSADRATALALPESAYYDNLDEIAALCESVGLQHNLKSNLPSPKDLKDEAAQEERERAKLKELLGKYGPPDEELNPFK